ncbi:MULTISPECIES: hypothetical protein [Streptomyces]|uniref:hypothetical protein n=1 Tax=Streptomyces TaxID=1883 RepID=UPI0004C07618|nr:MULTISPECIES: hypothetical protein [Streptomyces]KOU51667.1 signal protein [Streptomyces sp. MMG1522]
MGFRGGAAGLAAVLLVVLAGCGPRTADRPEGAAGAGSEAANARDSAAELQGRWWTWAASEPEATNPVADTDGSMCGRHQPRDVWFLAGTFGGQVKRDCRVALGRPIVVPVINAHGDRQSCADFMRDAQGTVVLDGEPVKPEAHEGDDIVVEGAPGNAVTGEEGVFTTTGCGLWVEVPPLDPGVHSLVIRGRSGDFSTGVDYALTVAAS